MATLTAVFSSPALGGSELFNVEFLGEAASAGVEIHAVVPASDGVGEAIRSFAATVEVLEIPWALQELSRFDSSIARSAPRAAHAVAGYRRSLRSVIRSYGAPVCALGFRSQLAVGISTTAPSCWVVHEIVPRSPSGRLWSFLARRPQRIFAYSRSAAQQPALQGRRVDLLPPRLSLDHFQRVGQAKSPPQTLGLVGDLFGLKNHLGFIEIVRRLRAAAEPVDGLIVGRDPRDGKAAEYAQRVRETAATNGIEVLSASPAEMPSLLERIDVLLHLSTVPESFGRVCVEAMAAGRPIIGFAHGAVAEIVEDGRTGILVSALDLGAVERAAQLLRRDQVLFATLCRGAKQAARMRWGAGRRGPTIGEALAGFATSGSAVSQG